MSNILGSSRIDCLKLHIHGIINHSFGIRKLLGSFDYWQHGADYVVSLLHNHLSHLHSITPAENWPHTLYLQVDNCWKENKNTTMLCYLGLLVHFGWFTNVQLFSLPTDHIHEDIDQMFST